MEGVKTYQDVAAEVEAQKIEEVRELLRKAADIKDPRQMWYVVRDIVNLLTLMIMPEAPVITEEMLARAQAMRG